ncbi:hypothetical protein AAFF_G00216480 [Aldrovandia affinis]|uniref:C1q domain-containing protein n=1 Tax=Aldrovandia affinis TaxID=143900 RepID=A0AAD7RGW4_9TELE|nr:hypothetical protein AAFF_G00216480 [Aldrovandia affinis]
MHESAVAWEGPLPCGDWDWLLGRNDAPERRCQRGDRGCAGGVYGGLGLPQKCFGPFTSNLPVPYDIVHLNDGHGYNPALGTFTAFRAGVYSFSFTAFSDVGAEGERMYLQVRLVKDGEVVASVWEDNREDSTDSGTQTVLVSLSRGSQVYAELLSGRMLCADSMLDFQRNTFSGHLVYPSLDD